jgi:hypothetical protein
MQRIHSQFGVTLIEVMTASAVGVLLLSVAVPVTHRVRLAGTTEQDAVQQQTIHAAMVRDSNGNPGGRLPTPGLINRLASNSLLEGLVVGGRAGRTAAEHSRTAGAPMAKVDERQHDSLDRRDLQQAMTRWASVVRDGEGLRELAAELRDAPGRAIRTRADFEDVALTATARVVAAAALDRTESRGCHHRGDYPGTDPAQAVSRTLYDQPAVAAPLL